MVESENKIVIILESAIDGGSIALFQNGREIDSDFGGKEVSKSDNLITIVENLLKRNNLKKSSIESVVVSNEPGSITGSRIGIAAAQGIADALGIRIQRVSLLESMLMQDVGLGTGNYIAAFYSEKPGIYYRIFTVKENKIFPVNGLKRISEIGDFLEDVNFNNIADLYLSSGLSEKLKQSDSYKNLDAAFNIIEVKGNPAIIIGMAFSQ